LTDAPRLRVLEKPEAILLARLQTTIQAKESILVSSKGIRKQTIGCEYLQKMHFLRR